MKFTWDTLSLPFRFAFDVISTDSTSTFESPPKAGQPHARKSCDEVEKNPPFRVGKHVVLELKSVVKVTATPLRRGVLVLVMKDASVSRLAGGFITMASVGNGRRPHPRFCRRRLRFWPEAITQASQLTRPVPRVPRKRRIPCHCLPSPNNGSIHAFREFRALW
jgi:hypothetical protein